MKIQNKNFQDLDESYEQEVGEMPVNQLIEPNTQSNNNTVQVLYINTLFRYFRFGTYKIFYNLLGIC